MYLIGGASREAVCFGDVQRFDFGAPELSGMFLYLSFSHLLVRTITTPERREWSRVKPAAGGDEFPARSGHSAVALGRCVFVFGGLSLVAGEVFNDVFVFDTRAFAPLV